MILHQDTRLEAQTLDGQPKTKRNIAEIKLPQGKDAKEHRKEAERQRKTSLFNLFDLDGYRRRERAREWRWPERAEKTKLKAGCPQEREGFAAVVQRSDWRHRLFTPTVADPERRS